MCGTAVLGCFLHNRFANVWPTLAGYTNLATTSIYRHIVADDDGEVGSMFAFLRYTHVIA